MKFSFLVPAYKSCFLKEALLSILSQSYEDYEIIVSDDASPEMTVSANRYHCSA